MSDKISGNTVNEDTALEIQSSFLANLNHAVRTSLNGVSGMTGILMKTGLTDEQMKYANIIKETSDRLLFQIENMIEISQISEGRASLKKKPCRLKDFIKDLLVPIIPSAVKRGIPISVEYGYNIPEIVNIDENKIRIVLTNLFQLSLRYSDRGNIILKISKTPDDNDKIIRLRFAFENGRALYDVLSKNADMHKKTGIADFRDFGEPTLSLAAVNRILDCMDSMLDFGDACGVHDLPFYFELFFDEECKEAVPQSVYSAITGKRALIFQDDILDMNPLVLSLKLWGVDYRITADADSVSAEIKEAEREGRPYDMFFCSGELTGGELTEIKSKIVNVIIIGNDYYKDRNLQEQFTAVLRSPVYPEELTAVLSDIYTGETRREEYAFLSTAGDYLGTGDMDEELKAKILLVEDDMVSGIYTSELLESMGCAVSHVENGKYAVNMIKHIQEYDLILMDCMMPVMDGYTASAKIRSEYGNDIPIIALTANTLEEDRERCVKSGMNDYLPKPVKEYDLYMMLKKYLNR